MVSEVCHVFPYFNLIPTFSFLAGKIVAQVLGALNSKRVRKEALDKLLQWIREYQDFGESDNEGE